MQKNIINLLIAAFLAFFSSLTSCAAEDFEPFSGEVTSDNINMRCDSTITAQTICRLSRGDAVEVVSGLYEWYKIRLPKNSPLFIKKDFVVLSDDKTARVSVDNVNVRMNPDAASAILGRVNKGETVNIHGLEGEWYRIEPVKNSFGWIHKKFIKKNELPAEKPLEPEGPKLQEAQTELDEKSAAIDKIISDIKTEIKIEAEKLAEKTVAEVVQKPAEKEQPLPAAGDNSVSLEGILKPYGKVFKRAATHKLATKDGKIFLLRGDTAKLNALTYRNVKIRGKIISLPENKYLILSAENIESLN